MTKSRIESISNTLLGYKVAYYAGRPLVSDAVYDLTEDELRELAPSHPLLTIVGDGKGGKVPHNPPMLSMAKTYDADDVKTLVAGDELVMTPKADGSSESIEYAVVGDTAVFRRASSRGNGEKGDDNSRNIKETKIPKSFKLPPLLFAAGPATVELRGELVFPVPRFGLYSDEFDSIRNAVAGLMNRKEVRKSSSKKPSTAIDEIQFLCYDIIAKNEQGDILSPYTKFEQLLTEAKSVIDVPVYNVVKKGTSGKEISQHIERFFSQELPYLVDGIVYRVNDMAEWASKGATSHHNNGSLAFKRKGETAETTIREIEIAVGRTGKVSFTAIFDEVELSGAVLRRATLHNAEFIEQGGYGNGAKVQLIRSGEVIPYVQKLLSPPSEIYGLPDTCPSCGGHLARRGPDIFCDNEACPSRSMAYAEYFLATLEVKGVAGATVEVLFGAGVVKKVGDFFRIKKEDVMKLDGFKDKSASNLLAAIQAKREVKLDMFLSLLGITGVGRTKGAEVAKIFRTMEQVKAIKPADLMALDGWAEKSALAFVEGFKERKDMIDDLLSVMTVKDMEEEKASGGTSGQKPLAGVTVVITGALSRPRGEIEKALNEAGAKTAGSVTKNTTYLVTNEVSSSSKSKKAAELGVPVISEADIMAKIGS